MPPVEPSQRTAPPADRRGPRPDFAPLALLALGSVALASLALAAPRSAAAQATDTLRQDTVYEIEPIAVRAIRPSATTGGVSAVVVRLDSVRFRPAPLLEDVLRELPLVQVRTNSRGEAQIALRGAEERQIAVLLDGVPLTLGWDHRTDLSVIPLTAARTVQLVRGLSSVLHGPNVLGGVVEIGMGSVADVRTEPLQFAGGLDHTGGYGVSAITGRAFDLDGGRLAVRAGVGRRERDAMAAPADLDPVYDALAPDDDRANSDLEHTDAFVTARYDGREGGWLSATTSAYRTSRGVPPELTEDGPRLWRYPEAWRALTVVAGGMDSFDFGPGPGEVTASLGVDVGSTRIEDYLMPDDPATLSSPAAFYDAVEETEEADDRTVTFRAVATQPVGDAEFRAAATWADIRHDEVITTSIATGIPASFPGEYGQRLWSVGAELELPFAFRLGPLSGGRVSGGLVYDGADTPETGGAGEGRSMSEWGGRIGLGATTGGGAVLLHTAVSRRGRFPALREMYSSALGRFEPNPDLRPEILTAVEGGFTARLGRYDVQVVGFHQRLNDAIARGAPPAGSDARFMRVNRDLIRSTGLELLAGYTVDRFALETELTFQDVEVVEPGREGVRAEYDPSVAGGIGGTVPLFAGLEASAEVEYWGEQYCSTPAPGEESFDRLEASTRTDLQLARTFSFRPRATFQRIDLELAVDNLTDSAVYDQCGLPQPGRTLRLQFRLN